MLSCEGEMALLGSSLLASFFVFLSLFLTFPFFSALAEAEDREGEDRVGPVSSLHLDFFQLEGPSELDLRLSPALSLSFMLSSPLFVELSSLSSSESTSV